MGEFGSKDSIPLGKYDLAFSPITGRTKSHISPRINLFEALPAALLSANGLQPGLRNSAGSNKSGAWIAFEADGGDWKANRSKYHSEYSYTGKGFRSGVNASTDNAAVFGITVHYNNLSAKVKNAGKIDVRATGLGVAASYDGGNLYVDGQLAFTKYDVSLASDARGGLASGISGKGYTMKLEIGFPNEINGTFITPRAGLSHVSATLDSVALPDSAGGGELAMKDAKVSKGMAGVLLSLDGNSSSPGELYASLDFEHELSGESKVLVYGEEISTGFGKTLFRLGLGGAWNWDDDRSSVKGNIGYASGTGGDRSYSAGIGLNFVF